MIIKNSNGDFISQGRVEIIRKYDDFTNDTATWLNLTGVKSINNNDSLILSKGSNESIKIESRSYLLSAYDALYFELGNFSKNTKNSMDCFYVISDDGTQKLELKNISTSDDSNLGFYLNNELIYEIPYKDLVWNNGLVVNKPCTYSINYNTLLGTFTLLSNRCVIKEIKLSTRLDLSKKYKVCFSSTSGTITISQVLLKLWKSV